MKVWLRGATWEKEPDTRHWEKMVSVTKLSFREEHILTALAWRLMVILPKGGVYHTGIGLLEVIWKF